MGMEDYALIPIHFQVNKWAMTRRARAQPADQRAHARHEVTRVELTRG
jgi:hypothetical protein